jgi:PAS domain S-box-containing protein
MVHDPTPMESPANEEETAEALRRRLDEMSRRALALLHENRRLREAIRESERHGKLILESTAEAVFGLDRHGCCEYSNPAAARLFGLCDASVVLGRPIDELLHRCRDVHGSAECRLLSAVRSGAPCFVEDEVFHRADGTEFRGNAWASPVERLPGQAGAVLTVVDVSERWRADEQARRTAAFREQILGIVGHDLRNPLGAIVMSVALLQKQGKLEGWQAKTVDRIRSSTGRMGRIIDDLLSYTRTRLGNGIPIEPQEARLDEICRRVLDELRAVNPDRSIELLVHGELVGRWDPHRLEQVVSNLVSNAVDHGDPESPVEVELDGAGDEVVLRVRNHGDPVPDEVLAHAFEPFHKGPEETSRRSSGLGLGLFIAREIVRGHRGEIAIQSEEDSGTLLTVKLPRG